MLEESSQPRKQSATFTPLKGAEAKIMNVQAKTVDAQAKTIDAQINSERSNEEE